MKTKTVNVMVMIQMDINPERTLADVVTGLDSINDILQRNPDECFHAQIFANSVDDSDITNASIEWNVGDSAVCPEPEGDDLWNVGGWVGTIENIKEQDGIPYAELSDADGDVWCVDLDRLEIAD